MAVSPTVRMGSRENHSGVMQRHEAGTYYGKRMFSGPSPTVSEGGVTFQTRTGVSPKSGGKRKPSPCSFTPSILLKTI